VDNVGLNTGMGLVKEGLAAVAEWAKVQLPHTKKPHPFV
jgi:hypothetical protein